MAYKQLVQPNIAINENAGWCLQYARRVFGLPAVEPTAWVAWTNTQYKHQDRNFPSGVAVPVWFDWVGDVGSGRFRYGHVAVRTADGKIWSSPLSGNGRAWFASVDDLTRAFGNGMTYVGWSEDISGTRVIKEEGGVPVVPQDVIVDEQLAIKLLDLWGRQGDAIRDPSAIGSIVGKPAWHAIDTLKSSQEGQARQGYLNSIDGIMAELAAARASKESDKPGDAERKLEALRSAMKDALGI
ncbi:hypothetical protein [Rhodococcus aetherivorans]|uniref:hypothetical protein n=1 Tax=Rhodococcus aetherivorans TaxID=191292 RepID=UPI003890CA2A